MLGVRRGLAMLDAPLPCCSSVPGDRDVSDEPRDICKVYGHPTVDVEVKVPVDVGIADCVRTLSRLPGVYPFASCQGTIGEGGQAPYAPYVGITWRDDAALASVRVHCDVEVGSEANHWGYAHPRLASLEDPSSQA